MIGETFPRARLVVALALVVLGVIGAADPTHFVTPPPPPRPQALPADTLFFDDFRHGLSRWTVDRPGVWSVRWGVLCADLPSVRQQRSLAYAGSLEWGDYAVDFDVCQMHGVDKGVVVRVKGQTGVGVDLRGPGYQDVLLYRRQVPLGHARAPSGNGAWHHVRVECLNARYRVFLDGAKVLERTDWGGGRSQGRIALPAYTGGAGECTVYYDNVLVTPLR